MTSFICGYCQIRNTHTVYLQKSMTVKSYMYPLCTVVIISLLSHYVVFMSEGLPHVFRCKDTSLLLIAKGQACVDTVTNKMHNSNPLRIWGSEGFIANRLPVSCVIPYPQ